MTELNEININIKGPSELKIQISISLDKTVLDLKRAIAEKADVAADQLRLIYSGRVLKDEDLLSVYKIQSSHTIHMVKSAARNPGSSSSAAAVTPQQIPAMQAGQNPSDPLTLLNGYQGHEMMAGFNPFAGMGINANDPNMMQNMMQSPEFFQQMSALMSNPAILDQVVALNPQLQSMAPQIRQVLQSDQFRQMVSNPDSLRTMMQMSSLFHGGGLGTQAPAFPAPGVPSTGTGATGTTSPSTTTQPGATGTGANAGLGPGAGFGLPNPAMLQQMLGAGPFGGAGGFGAFGAPPAAPTDSRPPEERFQVQLQQLQDMGFSNASQNVRALLATGGNVHSAIEYILSGGGL